MLNFLYFFICYLSSYLDAISIKSGSLYFSLHLISVDTLYQSYIWKLLPIFSVILISFALWLLSLKPFYLFHLNINLSEIALFTYLVLSFNLKRSLIRLHCIVFSKISFVFLFSNFSLFIIFEQISIFTIIYYYVF